MMHKCSFHSAVKPKFEESTMILAMRRLICLRKKTHRRLLSAAAAIAFIVVLFFQKNVQSGDDNGGDQSFLERHIGANGAWRLDTKAPEYGHAFDVALCQALEDLFDGQDVLDLGAGLGHYGRCFLRKREPMFPENPGVDRQFYDGINQLHQSQWWNTRNQRVHSWTGYDGSPNVEQVTKGFVKHMDLTKDQDFNGTNWDWVMSMEVGEHIPAQFEDSFISNIIKPVKHNLVLSWAVRGQGGRSHINELNNAEVVERFSRRGFTFDAEKSKGLRRKATASWFKMSLMVFKKNN